MNAARAAQETVGLNRAFLLCGVFKRAWYYAPQGPETCRRTSRSRRRSKRSALQDPPTARGAWPPRHPGN